MKINETKELINKLIEKHPNDSVGSILINYFMTISTKSMLSKRLKYKETAKELYDNGKIDNEEYSKILQLTELDVNNEHLTPEYDYQKYLKFLNHSQRQSVKYAFAFVIMPFLVVKNISELDEILLNSIEFKITAFGLLLSFATTKKDYTVYIQEKSRLYLKLFEKYKKTLPLSNKEELGIFAHRKSTDYNLKLISSKIIDSLKNHKLKTQERIVRHSIMNIIRSDFEKFPELFFFKLL